MSVDLLTESTFKNDVKKSQGTFLVDFFTPQCGPCRSMAPVFEAMSLKHREVKFVKVDASEAPDLVAEFAISGVPTIVAIKGGKEVSRVVGFQGEAGLEKLLKSLNGEGSDQG